MNDDLFVLRFEESLFDESTNKIKEDVTNLGVDILLATDIIKEIPFVKFFLSVKNIITDIYARHLLKNSLVFLQHLNDGSITEKERNQFLKKISNQSFLDDEVERILLLLQRATENKKSIIYAKLLKAVVKDKISFDDYHEMIEITDRIFLYDIEMLKFISDQKEIKDKSLINYKVGRLESLGLVQNHLIMVKGSLVFVSSKDEAEENDLEKDGCFLTELGEKYIEIIYDKV